MKNKKYWVIRLLIIICAGVVLLSCRKDSPVVEESLDLDSSSIENICNDLPPEPGIGYQFIEEGSQYLAPCFNPNNSNEFVYLRTGNASIAELVKYDLSSNTETVLCNSVHIASQPKWGRLGWIIFSTVQKKVWKIKDDGTLLTQLTFDQDDQDPHFNYNGDEIIYKRLHHYTNATYAQYPDLYKEDKMIIIDLSGNVLDSIMVKRQNADYVGIFSYQIWSVAAFDPNAVYYFGGMVETNTYGVQKLSFQDSIITKMVTMDPGTDGSHLLDLDQSGNFIYYTRQWDGIYEFDIQNSISTKIKEGCNSIYYKGVSISKDGTKLLIEKVNRTLLDNGYEVDEQHEIWMMDLVDGYNIKKILGE